MKRQPIIYNLRDPANDEIEAKLKYEDEHYDDEYERGKDEGVEIDNADAFSGQCEVLIAIHDYNNPQHPPRESNVEAEGIKRREMSEVHKFVCDECGKEKDLLTAHYGGNDTWQEINTKHKSIDSLFKHACSIECAIKILQKERDENN